MALSTHFLYASPPFVFLHFKSDSADQLPPTFLFCFWNSKFSILFLKKLTVIICSFGLSRKCYSAHGRNLFFLPFFDNLLFHPIWRGVETQTSRVGEKKALDWQVGRQRRWWWRKGVVHSFTASNINRGLLPLLLQFIYLFIYYCLVLFERVLPNPICSLKRRLPCLALLLFLRRLVVWLPSSFLPPYFLLASFTEEVGEKCWWDYPLTAHTTHWIIKKEFSLIRKREKNKPTDRHFSLSPFFFLSLSRRLFGCFHCATRHLSSCV